MWFSLLSRLKNLDKAYRRKLSIKSYLSSGQMPWRRGYEEYKTNYIKNSLYNPQLMQKFQNNEILPGGYGFRLDERVVEYPWVLSHLSNNSSLLLDAGGILDFPFLLEHPIIREKELVLYTLASTKQIASFSNMSYIHGDLRNMILREEVIDEIICVSTLEHIGMDNTLLYTAETRYREYHPADYKQVMKEFWRVLKQGGRLLITLPYGVYQDFGWLQQFNRQMLSDVINAFSGKLQSLAFYRYHNGEWTFSDQETCDSSVYFDIHSAKGYDGDFAAAARSVACLELSKSP